MIDPPHRVLVCEDDLMTRTLLGRMLADIGLTSVRLLADTEMLEAEVRDFDPSLVLIDRYTGGLDGMDALQMLADRDPGRTRRVVCLVTADARPEVRAEALGHGADGVLFKPFDRTRFRGDIEQLLAGRGGPAAAEPLPRQRVASWDTPPVVADFAAVFRATPACQVLLDPSLVILDASDSYLLETRTTRQEIVGRTLFEAFPHNPDDPTADGPDNLQASLDRVRAHLVPDTMAVHRYHIQRPASAGGGYEVRYWSPVNTPVLGNDGRLAAIIHRVDDVTDLVVLGEDDHTAQRQTHELPHRASAMERTLLAHQRELRAANAALHAANEAKGAFLSRASHELRTPLTSVLGFAQLLTNAHLEEQPQLWANIILKAGQHLLGLLNDLLDVSRIDSGELFLSLEPVAVSAVCADANDLIRPVAEAKGITLTAELSGVGGAYALADNQRLRQVLLNLMSNAIKYNRPGGEVRLSGSCPSEEEISIEVLDTGHGMTAEQLDRLFVPFERLDAAQTDVEGTGLGLVLSRRLTESMRGTLTVVSTADVGSTFTVTLRRVEPAGLADEQHTDGQTPITRRYTRPRRVLYVEDLVANVDLVRDVLRHRPDVTLFPVMHGELALDLAHKHKPDVILLDVHLPDLGGEDVLARLRGDDEFRDTPVIILSADATPAHQRRLLAAGANHYLTKPILARRLLQVLDEHLDTDRGDR